MKVVSIIIGVVLLVLGLCLTGWTWYDASYNSRISDASAYAGPVLIILGILRMARAAASVPLPTMVRLVVIVVAIGVGYGHAAALKAAFPQDQVVTNDR